MGLLIVNVDKQPVRFAPISVRRDKYINGTLGEFYNSIGVPISFSLLVDILNAPLIILRSVPLGDAASIFAPARACHMTSLNFASHSSLSRYARDSGL